MKSPIKQSKSDKQIKNGECDKVGFQGVPWEGCSTDWLPFPGVSLDQVLAGSPSVSSSEVPPHPQMMSTSSWCFVVCFPSLAYVFGVMLGPYATICLDACIGGRFWGVRKPWWRRRIEEPQP